MRHGDPHKWLVLEEHHSEAGRGEGSGAQTLQASSQGLPRLSARVGETAALQPRLLGQGEKVTVVSRASGRAGALSSPRPCKMGSVGPTLLSQQLG